MFYTAESAGAFLGVGWGVYRISWFPEMELHELLNSCISSPYIHVDNNIFPANILVSMWISSFGEPENSHVISVLHIIILHFIAATKKIQWYDDMIIPGLWLTHVWVRESKKPISHFPWPIVRFFLQSLYSEENTARGCLPSSTPTHVGQRSRHGGQVGSDPLHLFCS